MSRYVAQHGPIRWSYGAVVCTVDLVDCVKTSELWRWLDPLAPFWGDFSDGDDGKGRWAFTLDNVHVLAEPVPWRGQQGFFEVDLGAENVVRRDTLTLPLFGEG